jgi:hypothetical protein
MGSGKGCDWQHKDCAIAASVGLVRLGQQIEMFDDRRHGKVRADDAAPFSESGGLTKINRMVFQGFPKNHQDISLGRFNSLVDLEAFETFGFSDHFSDAALNGAIEFSLSARLDTDIYNFKNHALPL